MTHQDFIGKIIARYSPWDADGVKPTRKYIHGLPQWMLPELLDRLAFSYGTRYGPPPLVPDMSPIVRDLYREHRSAQQSGPVSEDDHKIPLSRSEQADKLGEIVKHLADRKAKKTEGTDDPFAIGTK